VHNNHPPTPKKTHPSILSKKIYQLITCLCAAR